MGAWYSVAYSRTKRLPSLKSELRKLRRKPRRPQSAAEQIAIFKMHSAGIDAKRKRK